MPSKRGRPPKINDPERIEKLLNALKAGNYIDAACAWAGIGENTYYTWMKKGEDAKSGKYREFRESVKEAKAQAEVILVAQIKQAIPEHWQAAAWMLERRNPEKWGRRVVQQEITTKGGGPVEVVVKVDLSDVSEEEIVAVGRKLRGIDGDSGSGEK